MPHQEIHFFLPLLAARISKGSTSSTCSSSTSITRGVSHPQCEGHEQQRADDENGGGGHCGGGEGLGSDAGVEVPIVSD